MQPRCNDNVTYKCVAASLLLPSSEKAQTKFSPSETQIQFVATCLSALAIEWLDTQAVIVPSSQFIETRYCQLSWLDVSICRSGQYR
jgi:hypothetical protein